MSFYGLFRHLDHDGLATGGGYVVRMQGDDGSYPGPYDNREPIWAFTSESLALRVAERMTQKLGRR